MNYIFFIIISIFLLISSRQPCWAVTGSEPELEYKRVSFSSPQTTPKAVEGRNKPPLDDMQIVKQFHMLGTADEALKTLTKLQLSILNINPPIKCEENWRTLEKLASYSGFQPQEKAAVKLLMAHLRVYHATEKIDDETALKLIRDVETTFSSSETDDNVIKAKFLSAALYNSQRVHCRYEDFINLLRQLESNSLLLQREKDQVSNWRISWERSHNAAKNYLEYAYAQVKSINISADSKKYSEICKHIKELETSPYLMQKEHLLASLCRIALQVRGYDKGAPDKSDVEKLSKIIENTSFSEDERDRARLLSAELWVSHFYQESSVKSTSEVFELLHTLEGKNTLSSTERARALLLRASLVVQKRIENPDIWLEWAIHELLTKSPLTAPERITVQLWQVRLVLEKRMTQNILLPPASGKKLHHNLQSITPTDEQAYDLATELSSHPSCSANNKVRADFMRVQFALEGRTQKLSQEDCIPILQKICNTKNCHHYYRQKAEKLERSLLEENKSKHNSRVD